MNKSCCVPILIMMLLSSVITPLTIGASARRNLTVSTVKSGSDHTHLLVESSELPISEWNYTVNPSSGSDVPSSVAVDSDNNIIAAGHDCSVGTNDYQWRIMKFNADGKSLWNYTLNPSLGTAVELIRSIAVDSWNNIIAVGEDHFPGDLQWRIMKFDSAGSSLWNYTINPSLGPDIPWDVAVDGNDNIVVVGYDSRDGWEWRIMKFDPDGNSLWNYTVDLSSYDDIARSVAIDGDNNIVVGGYSGISGFDYQWRVMKFNVSGSSLWNYTANPGPYQDSVESVAIDEGDDIILAGKESASEFDSGWRIMKLDADKNSLWNYTADFSHHGDIPIAVGVDARQNIFAAGVSADENENHQWLIMMFDTNGGSLWNWTTNPSRDSHAKDIAVDSHNNIIVVGFESVFGTDSQWRIMKFAYPVEYHIGPDGSVDPFTTLISSIDNMTYTVKDNIFGSISIERNDIVVDGAGHCIEGTGNGVGVRVDGRTNVTIHNMEIKEYWLGMSLSESSNSSVSGNNILRNEHSGIWIQNSSGNRISGNNMAGNVWATNLVDGSYNNDVFENTFVNNTAGIALVNRCFGNRVYRNNLTNNGGGSVHLAKSAENNIFENNITGNREGIWLESSSNNNSIRGNNIAANDKYGILVVNQSSSNTFYGNVITNNGKGVWVEGSYGNKLYHNNFLNNFLGVYSVGSVNIWDNGYPSGGNYWSGYKGTDFYSGSYQNETGFDGVGDSPYVIDQNNTDRYPLMRPFIPEIEEVWIVYRSLLPKFSEVNSRLNALNSTVNELLGSIDYFNATVNDMKEEIKSLNSTCRNLQDKIDSLNSTLQTSIDKSQEQYNSLSNQLNNIQNILYIFMGITIILIATTVYFGTRKQKTKPET